jgi:hypothetical protein
MASQKPHDFTAPSPNLRPVVHVPRGWLAVMTVLLVVPWLVVAGLYFGTRRPAGESQALPASEAASAAKSGPWGPLRKTPIVISPPLELISDSWGRENHTPFQWMLPGTTLDVMSAFLSSTGLTPGQIAQLQASARPDPRINGLVVTPTPELLKSLSPDVRAKLYVQLGRTPLNADEFNAFRFAATSSDAWFAGSLISSSTRRLVDPLLYRHGEHLYFADVDLIRAEVTDPTELRNLAKALLRQPTYIVELVVPDTSSVKDLVDYWGKGGRRTDIRPLLESVAGEGKDHSIDIIHLLPPLAREHLYRYPRPSAAERDRPTLANCLWTSLNFFNSTPDDRFLDVAYALDRLRQDYYVVESNFELGDVIVFLDDQGTVVHAAIQIADDLVFTKNGQSTMAPWVIVPIETLKDFYRQQWENPRVIYNRRKGL